MKELLENYHQLSLEKQKLVKLLLKEQGIDINSAVILPQKREGNLYPMSFAQQRIWFLEQLEPESPLYIIPSGVKIKGNLIPEFLVNGINEIVKRHEVLRTRFIEKDGEGYQEIIPELKIDSIEWDLSNNMDNYENELERIIHEEFRKPFNLSHCPLFRVVIIKISKELNYLLLPMHHIISDNWSTGILIKEILEYYNHYVFGNELRLEPIIIQYLDYSTWQREWLKGEELEKQKRYWINQLKDSNNVLEIIPDKKRPSVQTYSGACEIFEIDCELLNALSNICRNEDVTIFVLFMSAFQFLLSRYSNQSDINIGAPIANRNRAEIEELIGFFINTLVFRGKIDAQKTVSQFLQETKKVSLEAYSNQDVPFEMIVDELNLERDMSHTALFQAMLVLNNAPVTKMELEGLTIEPLDIDTGKTKFDLVLSLTKNDDKYICKFEFNTDLYKFETIKGLIKNFIFVIRQFVDNPQTNLESIELLDQKSILNYLSKTKYGSAKFYSDKLLHKEFEKIVELNLEKTAISDGTFSYTYSELNKLSNKIANELIENGVQPEQTIGIYLDRRIEYIAAILGVLKAGGVFVPIDINYPIERLNYIINDSEINFLLTIKEFVFDREKLVDDQILIDEIISGNQNTLNPNVSVLPENLAYIIYTSGSTGLPKGVMVEHSKIANHIQQMIIDFGINSSDKYLEFAAFNFDASIEQFFVPFLCGAEVFLRGNDYWLPSDFINLIINKNITIINPPTVYWNQLVTELKGRSNNNFGDLRLVISGGEEMKTELLSNWDMLTNSDVKLINAYGPTETIITSAIFKTEEKVLINNELNTPNGMCNGMRDAFIIGDAGKLVPPGIPGELCFGGDILARGYLKNPTLTAEQFIPDPHSNIAGSRIYRTGDLVRYNEEGFIEYLGRIDNQVKVRGFRIELSEIEQVLLKHDNVENAVVIINLQGEDNSTIIAYVVTDNNEENIAENLTKYCNKQLPNYMVPNHLILIDELPLNPSGKLDKKKLPVPSNLNIKSKHEFVAPRTDLEITITNIVADVLGINKVGIFDNFFELGGHSILAIKVISRVREVFGVDIQLKSLFENPTVVGLSEAVINAQTNLIEDDELENLLGELEGIDN